jgi:signal peptidase I
MEPTLQIGETIQMSTTAGALRRGDIVVFAKPANDYRPGLTDLIKRVIGLPGETASAQRGSVYVNGRSLTEPWLPRGDLTPGFTAVRIPPGHYFVMGDNRGDPADSRVFGPIPSQLVIGAGIAHERGRPGS